MSQRQSVLAENVANADTPGYRARDLAAPDFEAMLQRMRSQESARDPQVEESAEAYEMTLSGNTVVLDEQMMRVAENAAQYQLISGLYSKHLSMFKMALGRSR